VALCIDEKPPPLFCYFSRLRYERCRSWCALIVFSTRSCRALLVHVVDTIVRSILTTEIAVQIGVCESPSFRPRCLRIDAALRDSKLCANDSAVSESPSLYRHCRVFLYYLLYIYIDKICFNLLYCSHVVCFFGFGDIY
jgi:hypothetical protein